MKIDSKIPLPENKNKIHYPFNEMKVGDSFEVPDGKYNSCRISAIGYGQRNGLKFTVRLSDGKYRCWRIV